jgi:phytoene dehydrogenase-like protein
MTVATAGDQVESVQTRDGKVFTAPTIICNADPQKMSQAIGLEKFANSYRKPLKYEYSQTALTVYLGLRGIDLREHGFGRHNTWHLEQWDMNETWAQEMRQDWSQPWVFMATPSCTRTNRAPARRAPRSSNSPPPPTTTTSVTA